MGIPTAASAKLVISRSLVGLVRFGVTYHHNYSDRDILWHVVILNIIPSLCRRISTSCAEVLGLLRAKSFGVWLRVYYKAC